MNRGTNDWEGEQLVGERAGLCEMRKGAAERRECVCSHMRVLVHACVNMCVCEHVCVWAHMCVCVFTRGGQRSTSDAISLVYPLLKTGSFVGPELCPSVCMSPALGVCTTAPRLFNAGSGGIELELSQQALFQLWTDFTIRAVSLA